MKKLPVTYYKLPLGSIPFEELPSLEDVGYEYVYCKSLPLAEFMGLDYHLLSVYDLLDVEIDVADLKEGSLLFGEVVSDKLSTRGKAKCVKLSEVNENISKDDLPYLKYSPGNDYSSEGKWFYMKDGDYVILKGIRSEYERVKHLEGIAIYGDNIVRLRIVIELLKRNVERGIIKLSFDQYKDIAYKVLRTDPTLLKSDESIIRDGVDNWVPSMLSTPVYSSIPKEHRGRLA